MFGQAGYVASSYIYRADDAPRYLRGNRNLIIIALVNVLVLYPGTYAYYRWRNAQRDRKWNAMTAEEKAHYLATTKDVRNKQLELRFAH
ncbi:hypothetical protein M422DRAFT_172765 [Sphaerobolus stellatus SS14]|uniref:Uncharacterized protein n=1 Tax=Sphaerobolus stellatus (strain SS14) TaxID=990650 RepID=A0A0C9U8I1_SPHS4|nr:hypothetical protein M422DRAFT_193536 [Sphaerobolus stellatus SS14]KIJ41037.1 hypothetical protein M422DRAFT_172765 [Sphaerobolus stellatus SS14]